MKNFLAAVLLVFCLVSTGYGAGESVTIDHIYGLVGNDTIVTDFPIQIYFRVTNPDTSYHQVLNSFRFYSPDGAVWPGLGAQIDTSVFTSEMFGRTRLERVNHGGTDAYFLCTPDVPFTGIPAGFDGVPFMLQLGPIDPIYEGKTICIDTSTYTWSNPTYYGWEWLGWGLYAVFPEWPGERCFTISSDCCRGRRGNLDGDSSDEITVTDLTHLVSYMFQGGGGFVCPDEADVNGDGLPEPIIDDLMALVSYLFINGPPPANCP